MHVNNYVICMYVCMYVTEVLMCNHCYSYISCSLDYISALICHLHKEVRDAETFKLLCEVLVNMPENKFKKLARNMRLIYCILKCEADIIQQVDYEKLYSILKQNGFFTHYEEKILLEESTVKCIMNILKDKEMNHFDLFTSCLQRLPNSETLLAKIESELSFFNCNLSVNDLFTSEKLNCFRNQLIEKYKSDSFKKHFAGLDNKYNFVFPTLIEFDNEESINCKNHFYEQESCRTISSCLEIFNEGHRVVLLQGSPGSGKTTIAYKICTEWASGELKMFSHVIVMRLEDDRVARCRNIEDFIQHLIGNQQEGSEVASEIRKSYGEGVLIILEGWDHLLPKQQRDTLFTDLVKGHQLFKATIAITGRPASCVSLPYQFIDRKIKIFGFTERQVNEYIDTCCKDDPNGTELKKKFQSQLSHLQCQVICIPVNLCIIVNILKKSYQDIKSSLVATELYKMFLLYLLSRHQEKAHGGYRKIKQLTRDSLGIEMFIMLQNLAKMAYSNLVQNNVTFTEEVVSEYCFESKNVDENFDGMGLLHVVSSIRLYVERTYQFVHQNLQELLAAWHLSQQHDQKGQLHTFHDKEMFQVFYNDFLKTSDHFKSSPKSSRNCTIS